MAYPIMVRTTHNSAQNVFLTSIINRRPTYFDPRAPARVAPKNTHVMYEWTTNCKSSVLAILI